ncbi:anti-apoptotic protein NR13-like [Myxocyprinus asiaticus]|uniref:anti-apoptotic protein NR13-like n=1 Tax=Myxocyprinus asiaticus TaxID=70543 RepID=UPI0022227975|nr:anti-apoptotic protein NR13-like [Myxocyprinus asiaticus]
MSCRLRQQTLLLAEDYIGFCSGIQQTPPSESAEAMRYLAKEMEQQHRTKFQSLVKELLDNCGSDPSKCLQSVMREVVVDGKLNWGRVVSIFAFTGVLANELISRGGNCECSRRLAETIADYLGGEKQDWLIENGGWEGFCRFFQNARLLNQESSMKTALFAAAGVGLAGLTFLLVR